MCSKGEKKQTVHLICNLSNLWCKKNQCQLVKTVTAITETHSKLNRQWVVFQYSLNIAVLKTTYESNCSFIYYWYTAQMFLNFNIQSFLTTTIVLVLIFKNSSTESFSPVKKLIGSNLKSKDTAHTHLRYKCEVYFKHTWEFHWTCN